MNYICFVRAMRYTLVFVALYSVLTTIDSAFLGGLVDTFLARIDPHFVVEYVNDDFKLEAAIKYAQTDSTHISMRLLWTI